MRGGRRVRSTPYPSLPLPVLGSQVRPVYGFNVYIFWQHGTARGISVPRPGIELMPSAVEVQSLNYWATREVPRVYLLKICTKEIIHTQSRVQPPPSPLVHTIKIS